MIDDPERMTPERIHRSVLLPETMDRLVTDPDGTYVDGTLGAGGHAEALLEKLSGKGRLIGIDCDPDILAMARARLRRFGERAIFIYGHFDRLREIIMSLQTENISGVLVDLGMSSFQVDRPERGFSFRGDGPLDMRMDPAGEATAASLIRSLPEGELERILRDLGEEPFAGRIARAIVQERRRSPIETTAHLARLVAASAPRRGRIHPATRTFQALRITVNDELGRLDRFLAQAPGCLKPGGRMAVLSYHSLEDRRVKGSLLQWEREGVLKRITRKAVKPQRAEILSNPRSRSAKLRVAEKQ